MNTLKLNAKADKRLRAGHHWIYSNEVASDLKNFTAGEQVQVLAHNDKSLGCAIVAPNNLICARLYSRDKKAILDRSLLVHQLNIALSLRESIYAQPFYRLVYGDSDFLPGLVVDRYGDVLVVQISTAGMELIIDELVDALNKVVKPAAIVLKNDHQGRKAEQLEAYVRTADGSEVPEHVSLIENDTLFDAPLAGGQKTGWFYDHRENRALMNRWANGKRVLDVFSYCGGWGVSALKHGAAECFAVDSSTLALDYLESNAEKNGVGNKLQPIEGKAFEVMEALISERERFDVVVIDPPAFIKKKKDIPQGEQAYKKLNQLALRLLEKDGLLVSASCSMHLGKERHNEIVRASSRQVEKRLQVLWQGHQGFDHPVLPAIPETDYISAMFCRVLSS